eukprot:scaffold2658_cov246-Pinguiococcus_pyrenoidosus.AAC.2
MASSSSCPTDSDALLPAFQLIDKGEDGVITAIDLMDTLCDLGKKVTEKEVEEMLKLVDTDFDDEFSFDEFLTIMESIMTTSIDSAKQDIEAFRYFDRNYDGVISKKELYSVMRSLGENLTDEELDDMMAEGDLNGDGTIDIGDFKAMHRKIRETPLERVGW